MTRLVFITGGARSGKSFFAEWLAKRLKSFHSNNKAIAYIATSEEMDAEFKDRIKKHKERRDQNFSTYEESIEISKTLRAAYNDHNIFLLECLTTWLGNLFFRKEMLKGRFNQSPEQYINSVFAEIGEIFSVNLSFDFMNQDKSVYDYDKYLESSLASFGKEQGEKSWVEYFNEIGDEDKWLIIVSNETGLGIVPDNKLARQFRDFLGYLNQNISKAADVVFFSIAGIPVRIK